LRQNFEGKALTDGKKIFGRGRLTDKIINFLQNLYGMSIRNNKGNLYGMKKAVAAIIHHCTDVADPEKRHQYCPRDPQTWCKYHKSEIRENYKPNINLPHAARDSQAMFFKQRFRV